MDQPAPGERLVVRVIFVIKYDGRWNRGFWTAHLDLDAIELDSDFTAWIRDSSEYWCSPANRTLGQAREAIEQFVASPGFEPVRRRYTATGTWAERRRQQRRGRSATAHNQEK